MVVNTVLRQLEAWGVQSWPYRDAGSCEPPGEACQCPPQQQHPEAVGTRHECVASCRGHSREHDAELPAQEVVEDHGTEAPSRCTQGEHGLQRRGAGQSGLGTQHPYPQ